MDAGGRATQEQLPSKPPTTHNIKDNWTKKSPHGKVRAEIRFKAPFVADCCANPPYSVTNNPPYSFNLIR
jgi:hypothetical protein